jgi:hypothetical protein
MAPIWLLGVLVTIQLMLRLLTANMLVSEFSFQGYRFPLLKMGHYHSS